jgi:DMSO reductase anchor subunit
MILLLFEIVHAGFLYAQLNSMDVSYSNQFISDGLLKSITIIRIAVVCLAIVLLLLSTFQEKAGSPCTLLLLSIALIFIEMLIGRYVFFASYVRVGI